MTTELYSIHVNDIIVGIVRKNIKNLHLAVYPPHGRVRVAVPLRLDDDAVRLAVIARLGWIRRQQARFNQQERQSQRDMVTGESHYVQGQRYRLDVIEHDAPPSVQIINNSFLELRVRPHTSRDQREAILSTWYRERLRQQLPALLEKWQAIIDVAINSINIRKMKTRWGTCHIEKRQIWLNLELAKKPFVCLEYVLVHELVHLLERHHNDRFKSLMDTFMPHWSLYRDELNQSPLAHEDWTY